MTRHGAGPFVTEDESLSHPEAHNGFGPWQQGWRQGHQDLVALDYAVRAIGGVDELVVSHMDFIDGPQRVCESYGFDWELPQEDEEQARLQELQRASERLREARPVYQTLDGPEALLSRLEAVAGAPITITSHGPTAEDKHDRRPEHRADARHQAGPVGLEAAS